MKKPNCRRLQKLFLLQQLFNQEIPGQTSSWLPQCRQSHKPIFRTPLHSEEKQCQDLHPTIWDHQEGEAARDKETHSNPLLGPLEAGIQVEEGGILEDPHQVEIWGGTQETCPTEWQDRCQPSLRETGVNLKSSFKNGTSIEGLIEALPTSLTCFHEYSFFCHS